MTYRASIPRLTGRRCRSRSFFAAVLLVAGALLAAVAPATAGEAITVEGTTHIQNGAAPAHGTRVLALDELWRAGGDDDEVFFGVVTQVRTDADGNIYLLDTQLSEVQVYSPDGKHLKTLSRQGSGPGETNNPSDLLFMPDGNLGLVQTFPGKIIKIDLEGDPAGVFEPGVGDPTAGGFPVIIDAQHAAGNLVLAGIHISMDQANAVQTRTNYLASFAADGSEKARYEEKVDTWDFKNFVLDENKQYFVHFRRWTLGDDGRVYTAPYRNRYAVNVYNPDGSVDRVIEREYASWKRNDYFMKRVTTVMDAQSQRFGFEVKTHVEDTEPDIANLRTGADGSLWVLPSRGMVDQPDGIMMTYDVYDPQGNFDHQAAIATDADGVEDGLFFFGDDRAIIVTGFMQAVLALQGGGGAAGGEAEEESTPMEVICCAVHPVDADQVHAH